MTAEDTIPKALRGLAFFSFLAAGLILFMAQQEIQTDGTTLFITSHDWPGYLFCITVYFIGSAYNVLVLAIPLGSPVWKKIPHVDLILLLALAACLGVWWEIVALTSFGYPAGGLNRMCGPYSKLSAVFCPRVTWSVVMATVGFVCNYLLLFYTIDQSCK